jgi:hypothetical protein
MRVTPWGSSIPLTKGSSLHATGLGLVPSDNRSFLWNLFAGLDKNPRTDAEVPEWPFRANTTLKLSSMQT